MVAIVKYFSTKMYWFINNWPPLLIISLHWLLKEPLVGRAHLNISPANFPSLQNILCSANVVALKDVVDLKESRFGNRRVLATSMMLRSLRLVSTLLKKWRANCTIDEIELLTVQCVHLFFLLVLSPNLQGCTGLLLTSRTQPLCGWIRSLGNSLPLSKILIRKV